MPPRRPTPLSRPWSAALALTACLTLAACSGGATPVDTSARPDSPTTPPSATAESSESAAPPASAPAPPAGPSDPLSPRPALESPAPLGRPSCLASALSVVDADAVTIGNYLEQVFVIRTNGADCQLQGYPGLRFSSPNGRPLTVQVDHGGHGLPATTPTPVTLSRSTTVSFGVATERSGNCQATSRVAVTLPATDRPLSAATTMQVCAGSVGVTPIQRRADADTG